jgi:XTP/dITP diphosphohydrolase
MRALLEPLRCQVSPLSDFTDDNPEEPAETFVENALIKARHACVVSDLPAIADDSGIVVDALQGRPGVRSARFAGPSASDEENLQRLLRELEGVPDEQRTARFVSLIVLLRHAQDPLPLVSQGTWEGRMLTGARGENGFGYDPIFAPLGMDRSSAELDPAEKNAQSHRGKALSQLLHNAGWT